MHLLDTEILHEDITQILDRAIPSDEPTQSAMHRLRTLLDSGIRLRPE
ncbi:hypothetical protein [Nocardia pseudobrasiliensis]|uniref:Uncharacterized protein n=1 Tax=Nocardia pseudobrasiliensis TaxID=45979 RepID=A0A370I4S9_9NOCA|nr:hypothetical protein [Nocardia pseudobrasiliensis]RDI65722.1 hypothetical protein DFR76_10537 [Nocardia pseudobrasiliensis]